MNAAATVYDGSHKYIRITDIDDNSHLYSQNVPVSPEGQVDEKYRVRENDILLLVQGHLWVKAIATSVVTVIFIMLAFLFAFM